MTFLHSLWRGLTLARTVAANLLFLLILVVVLIMLFGGGGAPTLPNRFALELELQGVLVERATPLDPLTSLMGGDAQSETVLGDIEELLVTAADDDRVASVVLNTSQLAYANMVQIARLGRAINSFKQSGKPVLAHGAYYSQPQYLIASYADSVYLHPMGETLLTGLGSYQPYFASLLKKIDVDVHVFRVGKFKSAVEPYLRDSMSPEAAEASTELLDQLWGSYRRTVAQNRGLDEADIDAYINDLRATLETANGDIARVAVEARLVDELLTPDAFEARIAEEIDTELDDLNRINTMAYLFDRGIDSSGGFIALPATQPSVGLITATGAITNGSVDGMTNGIVAEEIIELLRKAKDDDNIRALVVHVDSPGGEVIASELIRREIELVQLAGKPVVMAMAGTAASGGYWISATADKIVASPDTITGSIGIFGVLPNLAGALNNAGINMDGVGTHALAGGMSIARPLSDDMAGIIQTSVNQGYDRFITLVARGRDLEREQVEKIAQGRVWSGAQALELGLVDELGNLQDALASAARLANLADDFEVQTIDPPLSPRELLLRQLSGNVSLGIDLKTVTTKLSGELGLANVLSRVYSLGRDIPGAQALTVLLQSTDRSRAYALCEACDLTW